MRRSDHADARRQGRRRRSGRITGRGCAISQASASLLTDEIKGKPLKDVAAFRADDLLDLLGIEISPARLKCAMLSHDSLQHVLGDLGVPTEAATQMTAPHGNQA